jgi:OmpA-OmpF porin, OOP family
MKKITLLLFITVAFSVAHAQSVLYYNFQNSLNEAKGLGPTLTILGDAGEYVQDTLSEIGDSHKIVYRFQQNCGVQFDNNAAGHFIKGSYTIELYFKFDYLNSWKRVVDWKNRKTDWGAYVYNGKLNFYNIIYSDEAPVVAGEYTYYVITRDSTTNQVVIYTDAEAKVSFTDFSGDALIDNDGFLNFFHDDLQVTNEASSGSVAMLKLYNYALDSSAIKTDWESIGSSVFSVDEKLHNLPVEIYPNPASSQITLNLTSINSSGELKISILDAKGQLVYTSEVYEGSDHFVIPVANFKKGLYFLRLEGEGTYANSKFLVR